MPTPLANEIQETIKFVVLGATETGKSVFTSLAISSIKPDTPHPTIGAAFGTKVLQNGFKAQIWDTAGQEKYHSLAHTYYRGSNVAIIIFNEKNPVSIERAKSVFKELNEKGPEKLLYMFINIDKDNTEQAVIKFITIADLKVKLGEDIDDSNIISVFTMPQVTKTNQGDIGNVIRAVMQMACEKASQQMILDDDAQLAGFETMLMSTPEPTPNLSDINTQILFGFTAVLSLSAIALALTVLSGGAAFAVGLAGGIGLAGTLCGYGFFSEEKATSTGHSPSADSTPTPMSAV